MGKPPLQSDEDSSRLLERLTRGDRDAEEALVRHFRPRILAFLRVRMQEPETAEELCHDVLLALLSRIRQGQLQITESLPNYVFAVARNIFNDYLSNRLKRSADPLPENFDIPAPTPDTSESERQRVALEALNQLESLDRRILEMTLIDSLKPSEIAARIGLSSEVVRQRKSRAIRKLSLYLANASQTGTQKD